MKIDRIKQQRNPMVQAANFFSSMGALLIYRRIILIALGVNLLVGELISSKAMEINNNEPIQVMVRKPTNMPEDPNLIDEGFVINGGADSTRDKSVVLDMIAGRPFSMKIGFNQDCKGSTWQDYRDQISLKLPLENQLITISVQFRDLEGFDSPCYYASILQDSSGPVIRFGKFPMGTIREGATADVTFQVNDLLSKVTKVECEINGAPFSCGPGENSISWPLMAVGNYRVVVIAEDELGNSSQDLIQWNVESATKPMSLDLNVSDKNKVDVLFVIDNSASMAYEQKSMAKRTSNFLSLLNGMDWQVAVTTTDVRPEIAGGDGHLAPMKGLTPKQFVLNSSMDSVLAQKTLSKTLQREANGDKLEQGIRATYRLVDLWKKKEARARQFLREESQLAVVLISDEDESAKGFKNIPQNLVSYINSTFSGQKPFVYHSIITIPGDKACKKGNGATYGNRYKVMSNLTGGIIGSVCALDYAEQIGTIAESIKNLSRIISLACEPAVGTPLTIFKSGVPYIKTYKVEGVNLKFDEPLDPGNYHVDYNCLK